MIGHHISIRTHDIHKAIAFYEYLGFSMEERFTTGITLACWLKGKAGRIELIQIPEPKPAPDAFHDEHYVGYYHFALDLTSSLKPQETLRTWIDNFRADMEVREMKTKILLYPNQQQIGDKTYDVAFITDIDGLPIELLREKPQ